MKTGNFHSLHWNAIGDEVGKAIGDCLAEDSAMVELK